MKKGAVIFDFNRTLFDPSIFALYHGVKPMLEELERERTLVLFSRKNWDRSMLLEKLGIDQYFTAAHFVDKKTPETLQAILTQHAIDPEASVIVGDMLGDEICAGNELGLTTVWFQQSSFGDLFRPQEVHCVPKHTVHSIEELRKLLKSL